MNKTILFGNGMNRLLFGSLTWESLLEDLSEEFVVDCKELINSKQYTMVYEQIVASNNVVEEDLKINIANHLKRTKQYSDSYCKILQTNANNYLTTNYEHYLETEVEKKLSSKVSYEKENIYSIRRNVKFIDNNIDISIWNIHGSIREPKSIMLGLDHYCGYIGKIDSYIKGSYVYEEDKVKYQIRSIAEKLTDPSNKINEFVSWVDLFFTTNIYIIGLGMDYSETDIWWVLNRRARLKKDMKVGNLINNRIIYFGDCDIAKKNLLKSFGVEIVNKENETYDDFYLKTIDIINHY